MKIKQPYFHITLAEFDKDSSIARVDVSTTGRRHARKQLLANVIAAAVQRFGKRAVKKELA